MQHHLRQVPNAGAPEMSLHFATLVRATPQPSTAAAAQGDTTPRSSTGCKALKPKLGKLGCWWNQASEQTLALMDVQGDRH